MKYQPKLILMPTDDGIENTTAIAAEGTGLSYHHGDAGYTILAQNMGYTSIAPACICKDERMVRLFISELRKLTDWTKDEETIRVDMFTKYAYAPTAIEGCIQRAFSRAVAKYDETAAYDQGHGMHIQYGRQVGKNGVTSITFQDMLEAQQKHELA